MPGVKTPFRVEFSDGREFHSTYLPIDALMSERKFGGKAGQFESTMYAAYHALRREEKIPEASSFEDFIPQLLDYEENPEAGNGQAPQEPSTGQPSPPSPTEPASPPAS